LLSDLQPPLRSHTHPPHCILPIQPPPRSTLFPYTTLFRSITVPSPIPASKRRTAGGVGRNKASSSAARRAMADFSLHAVTRSQRSEEHTSELQSHLNLVCRLLLEKKKKKKKTTQVITVLTI